MNIRVQSVGGRFQQRRPSRLKYVELCRQGIGNTTGLTSVSLAINCSPGARSGSE